MLFLGTVLLLGRGRYPSPQRPLGLSAGEPHFRCGPREAAWTPWPHSASVC